MNGSRALILLPRFIQFGLIIILWVLMIFSWVNLFNVPERETSVMAIIIIGGSYLAIEGSIISYRWKRKVG